MNFQSSSASYLLGPRTANDLVTIDVNFPSPTPSPLKIVSFRIRLYDHTATLKYPNNPINFGTVLPIPTSPGKVPRASGTIPSDGTYFIVIRSDGSDFAEMQIAEITIAVNNVPIHKIVDIIQPSFGRYFANYLLYVDSDKDVTFIADSQRKVLLFYIDQNNQFSLLFGQSWTNIASKTLALTKGFYARYYTTAGNLVQQYIFPSDPYHCPFSSDFMDFTGMFKACFHF